MYICNDCGEVFEDCKVVYEPHPYGMGSAYEKWYLCPHCDSTDIDEAKECERCGEYFADLRKGLCDCCYDEMYD